MAPTYSAQLSRIGSIAPDFSLKGVDEKIHQLSDFTHARALVVLFICNHCPYVIATQDRFNQLAKETTPRGIQWVGINSNDSLSYPEDSFDAMKIRAKEKGLVFPYLHDSAQEVAKAYGAVCTPEIFVYRNESNKFVLRYNGRLDDNWNDADAVTQKELAMALERILEGKLPDPDQKPSMGCSIKWM
jgi:peroxiredoxin